MAYNYKFQPVYKSVFSDDADQETLDLSIDVPRESDRFENLPSKCNNRTTSQDDLTMCAVDYVRERYPHPSDIRSKVGETGEPCKLCKPEISMKKSGTFNEKNFLGSILAYGDNDQESLFKIDNTKSDIATLENKVFPQKNPKKEPKQKVPFIKNQSINLLLNLKDKYIDILDGIGCIDDINSDTDSSFFDASSLSDTSYESEIISRQDAIYQPTISNLSNQNRSFKTEPVAPIDFVYNGDFTTQDFAEMILDFKEIYLVRDREIECLNVEVLDLENESKSAKNNTISTKCNKGKKIKEVKV